MLSGDLALPPPGESTAVIAHRVAAARARQAGRYAELSAERRIRTNAEADGTLLDAIASSRTGWPRPARCALPNDCSSRRAATTGSCVSPAPWPISRRAETVGRRHVAEALSYRRLTVLPENAM